MMNDYTLSVIARERQEQVRRDVARCRRAANTLTRIALLSAFFAATIGAAYSGARPGTFSGVVLDDRDRPVSGAAVRLCSPTKCLP